MERDTDALHPNQKPVGGLHPLIRMFTPASGTILDPFMGSGSTLLAARDFGLDAIGIDCEIRWCRYAALRLSQGLLFPARHMLTAGLFTLQAVSRVLVRHPWK